MTILEILKQHLPSKEIKARLKNGQIKLNSDPVINLNQEIGDPYMELGEYLCLQSPMLLRRITALTAITGDITRIFDINTVGPVGKALQKYNLLSYSKKDHLVIKKL